MTNSAQAVLLIAGPTASGKSSFALKIAAELDGVIINADSMQVYKDLRILTARPTEADEARAPHKLYGYRDGAKAFSVAAWVEDVAKEITEARQSRRLPIVVGGSGLYVKTLMEGIVKIPDVSDSVRQAARRLYLEQGHNALYDSLKEKDPEGAANLKPKDRQRVLRAWEVLVSTGTPLRIWQEKPPRKLLPNSEYFSVLFVPPREEIYGACNSRLVTMVGDGALQEVQVLINRALDPKLPVMKALAVAELAAHLNGKISLEEAIAIAQQRTRNYAKRQNTWFKNQFRASETLYKQYSESLFDEIFPKIRHFLLT
ncbi:MAG: tRNA (adenosine(37)-N6)-dimethylallyltransferase MiaA [Rhodospirillaceae bacterium]